MEILLTSLPRTYRTSTDKVFLKSMFLKMFFPHNSDVFGGLASEMAYASVVKQGITKKAFKFL